MTVTRLHLVTLTFALLTCAPALARDAAWRDRVLSEAQEAFEHGSRLAPDEAARAHFQEAAAKYEALVADGVRNGRLFYNLGNAYFRLGRTGLAVLNYLRAERLAPTDRKIRANLRFARGRALDALGPARGGRTLAGLLFWHYEWSVLEKARIAVVLYVLAWLLMLVREFHRRRYWTGLAVAFWLAAACLVGSVAYAEHEYTHTPVGVVTAERVEARKGAADSFAPAFDQALHEGAEFTVLTRRPNWLEVQLPDGKTGWLPAKSVGVVTRGM